MTSRNGGKGDEEVKEVDSQPPHRGRSRSRSRKVKRKENVDVPPNISHHELLADECAVANKDAIWFYRDAVSLFTGTKALSSNNSYIKAWGVCSVFYMLYILYELLQVLLQLYIFAESEKFIMKVC